MKETLKGIFESLCSTYDVPHMIKIGAHDGVFNDDTYHLIRDYSVSVDFFEPHPEAFERLKKNYPSGGRYRTFQTAVSDCSAQAVLYSIDTSDTDYPDWVSQISSLNRSVTICSRHLSVYPDLKDHLIEIPVSVLGVKDMMSESWFCYPQILVVDTEGHDHVIIREFLDSGVRPELMIYETKHLKEPDLNGIRDRIQYAGYRIHRYKFDDLAVLI